MAPHKKSFQVVYNCISAGGDKLISTSYQNARTPLEILCSKCNKIFRMNYDRYRRGSRCGWCYGTRKYTLEEVAERIAKDGNTLLSNIYVNNMTKLQISCGKCGNVFHTCYNRYLKNKIGCNLCINQKFREERRYSYKHVKSIIEENGDKLLSQEYINSRQKLCVKCGRCNHVYEIMFMHYIRGVRCGKSCISSKGEEAVEKYLKKQKIRYRMQERIPECRNIRPLPFDFYCEIEVERKRNLIFVVPVLIEYNGIQHYKPRDKYGGEEGLKKIQLHDDIKSHYASDNNIPLLVIKYSKYRTIDRVIEEFVNKVIADNS